MRKILTMIIQVMLGLLFLSPLIWMVSASLKPNNEIFKNLDSLSTFVPTNITLENYVDMFERSNMVAIIGVSVLYISIVIVAGVIVNSLAGYAIACLNFPFKKTVLGIILAFYIVPFETVVLPLYLVCNAINITNTIWALSLPFVADCFNIFLFKQFFQSFPITLSEAAKIDGCSTLGIFARIVLPNSLPVVATSIVLTIVARWSDFMWPLMAVTDPELKTVQLGIQSFFTDPPIKYGPIMAALVFTTLPIILIFIFLQKYYVQGVTSSGIKG
ncbi:ABC transporter permease [Candidatus Epulonipiscium fishelsonii]|nr:ABC transporter permease [Epulopiscium sp. SCG-C06WGA-EpuloA1]